MKRGRHQPRHPDQYACRVPGRVAGVAVLDQEHPLQAPVPPAERPQLPDVVLRRPSGLHRHLHPARVDDQEQQQVDRAVPGVLELLLLDGAGDGPADRAPLQHLEVGHLIDRHRPDALAGQPLGIAVAPEHLLGPLLELGVEAGRPPVAGAVRLQVHVVQDPPDGAGADGVDDAVGDRLAGQVLAGPVGDVQPLGDRLQAGQLDDLGPLQGGKSPAGAPGGARPAGVLPAALLVAAADPPDGGAVALQAGGDRLDRLAGGDGQDDAGVLDLEPGQAAAAGDRLQDRAGQRRRWSAGEVCGHAWDNLRGPAGLHLQHTPAPNLLHDFVPGPLGAVRLSPSPAWSVDYRGSRPVKQSSGGCSPTHLKPGPGRWDAEPSSRHLSPPLHGPADAPPEIPDNSCHYSMLRPANPWSLRRGGDVTEPRHPPVAGLTGGPRLL